MRPRQVIAATLVALALGAATFGGSASAQGPTQGNLPSGVERYIPPGPMAPDSRNGPAAPTGPLTARSQGRRYGRRGRETRSKGA